MNKMIFAALAVLTAGTVSTTIPAISAGMNRTVVCNDGTVFKFGDDAISDQVACADHGGLKPNSPFKAMKAQLKNMPPVPVKPTRVASTASPRKGNPDGTYGGKNKAVAWTAGCYNEFGPGATHPNDALLQKCLGN